jgi:anti-sigma B factor antagonist
VQITEQQQGAVTVVAPNGPVALADADQLRSVAMQVIDRSRGRIVLDATAMPFLDSRGLEVLLEVTERLNESGAALKMCGVKETVREIMELTDLAGFFEYYDDVNCAVRSFI